MQSVGVWSLKNDTTKSFGLNRRQYRELLGSWQEELFHELVTRDFIFKGNTPKTVNLIWVSMCVALWELWGQNTVEGRLQ